MRVVAAFAVGALCAVATAREASAQDNDVDLIPKELRSDPAPAKRVDEQASTRRSASTVHAKLSLEDALTLVSAPRPVPVPYPSPLYDVQDRTSLDVNVRWEPSKRLTATLSDRFNVIEQDDQSFLSSQTARNDFREGYVTWEPASNSYVEAGRINVRNGMALGFSPTDFFKTGSLVGQASLDPSVLRQNRLGTLMAREQTIWNGGSASVAFAPKLAEPPAIVGTNPPGWDPSFDATNGAYRVLCTLNLDVADLNPEALGYFELHRSKVGLNISHPIGDAIVAYAEWAAGPEKNLAARALAYGQETGTLPLSAPVLPRTETSFAFRSDAAAGFSWTIATRVTVNIEYHLHEGGFTRQDWQNWFAVGSAPNTAPAVTGALWYVRGYANDQQEPMPMHQVFVRADWPKIISTDLELTGFAFMDLLDGSVLTQVSASYYASDAWTFSAYTSANIGDPRTERGSAPQRFTAILDVTRYL